MTVTSAAGLDDLILHPESGVYVLPEAGTAVAYLDGAERYLLEALSSSADVGVFSPELRTKVKDWASLYHLTPYRSTIMDALGFANTSARVLELGAGCGAVTRWLGEHFDSVDAVEGSLARARVARERCRDLESVRVAAANFFDLDFGGAYDIATLIGVLEYSHLYHPEYPHDPARAAASNLELVRSSLTDDGLLVIAIENKFGLKYWSGNHEDHSSRRYDGLEGYPTGTSAVTFSAVELERLIAAAGFSGCDFYLPFPDYKLASTIIDASAADPSIYPANWIETPFPDRAGPQQVSPFNEALALRELVPGGLLRDLANSFLILAYNGDREQVRERLGIESGWAVRRYSLDRQPAFCKRASLERTAAGELVVRNTAAAPGSEQPAARLPLTQTFSDQPFHPGHQIQFLLHEAAATGSLHANLPALVEQMSAFLLDNYAAGQTDAFAVPLLRGDALDVTWSNVVAAPETGLWRSTGSECSFSGLLPLDFVLWRGLHRVLDRHRRLLTGSGTESPAQYASALVSSLFPADTAARSALFQELERFVERAAGADPAGHDDLELSLGVQELVSLVQEPCTFQVLAFAKELVEQPALLSTYATAFGAGDRVTLIAYAPDADVDAIAPALQAALTKVGCDSDVMLLAIDREAAAEQRILETTQALLSLEPAAEPFAEMRRFSAGDGESLRALVFSA